jgi:hypothetical protein
MSGLFNLRVLLLLLSLLLRFRAAVKELCEQLRASFFFFFGRFHALRAHARARMFESSMVEL